MAEREAGEVTMTVEGAVLGTPAYMSREQAAGHAHDGDGRSDVSSRERSRRVSWWRHRVNHRPDSPLLGPRRIAG
jgi:hypothetical protein